MIVNEMGANTSRTLSSPTWNHRIMTGDSSNDNSVLHITSRIVMYAPPNRPHTHTSTWIAFITAFDAYVNINMFNACMFHSCALRRSVRAYEKSQFECVRYALNWLLLHCLHTLRTFWSNCHNGNFYADLKFALLHLCDNLNVIRSF